jgi:AcrR family transcriptional regulator
VRIVEAAAQLFARQGFKAATTREIAHLADLNEATLFRYFPRKPDLFRAAVESRLSRVRLGRDLQTGMAANDDPANVVPMIVSFLLNTLSQQPELPRLLQVATFELRDAEIMIRTSGADLRFGSTATSCDVQTKALSARGNRHLPRLAW